MAPPELPPRSGHTSELCYEWFFSPWRGREDRGCLLYACARVGTEQGKDLNGRTPAQGLGHLPDPSWNIAMLCEHHGHKGHNEPEGSRAVDPAHSPLSGLAEGKTDCPLSRLMSSAHQEVGTERLCRLLEVTQKMRGGSRAVVVVHACL